MQNMNFQRSMQEIWSPGRIFAIAFLCCFAFAKAAEVDPRFGGSARIALDWQDLKGKLPHDKIPATADEIKDAGSWGMDYGIGIAKIVGPGFVIAILTLLGGVIYGIIKLIRSCCRVCCSSKDSDDEASEYEEQPFTWQQTWCPTAIYAIAWVFLFTGLIIGLINNPRFNDGVNEMGDSVISVGTDAVSLGNGLLTSVDNIVNLIPTSIVGLQYQVSGVEPLADEVVILSDDINGTSAQVAEITTTIGNIDAGNTSAVSSLYNQLASINNQSTAIITSVADLTSEIADKLRNTLDSTIGNLDSKVADINETVDGLKDTASGIIDQANDLVDKVITFVNDGKSYNKSRAAALTAIFVVMLITTLAIIAGFIFKIKIFFNIVAALSFIFLFLLWFSGSIHFLLGMVLFDACPVIDVAVRGMLPSDSEPATVLQGCLYEHRGVLESLNITAYNLTDVFDYRHDFEEFAKFSEDFNFTEIDGYFDSIQNLYTYNLTAIANNITVANFGWNESRIYDALDVLNNNTYPQYYSLSNYTQADPTAYPYPKNNTVNQTITVITTLREINTTIYNKTDVAKQQLIDAQDDIDALLVSMDALRARFDGIKAEVNTLQTTNITNCIAILDNLQSNITAFFALGDCSFLGDTYLEVRTSLCETMQPAIDCLTVAQFLAGLALIPMAIIAEVLSYRIPKCPRLRKLLPCFADDETGGYDDTSETTPKHRGGGYVTALTDSPAPSRHSGITATIGGHPMSDSTNSATSSPDFSDNRRMIGDHLTNR